MGRWSWVVGLVCACAASGQDEAPGAAQPDQPVELVLWGGRSVPDGEVFEIGPEGIVFEDPFGVHRTVRWDYIRAVRGEHADEAEPFMGRARLAWRARTRLERGDAVTAEPMFEELYPIYEGLTGEMASMVAEGLLRCRLRRSAQTAAVRPWLAYLVSEGAPPYRSRMAGALRPACDEKSGLVPSLAPVWLDTPAVEAFARSEPIVVWTEKGTAAPRRAEVLESLYRYAARFECGLETGMPTVELTSGEQADEGLRLVHAMVAARCGDEVERGDARRILVSLRDKPGAADGWIEAWCRLGIGRSLLREADPETRRLGVVELLHLPARFNSSQPYLAGVALAEAAVALDEIGDSAGGASLLAELRDSYSTHAATVWDPVRSRLEMLNNNSGR